ncbi:BldC family transcriptional regulator [Williamsia muralis]|jgi:excisionase family DNA binding protein|nr:MULTISPECIES: BldC family transcriptional regulator [Williamsia]MCK0520042.1 BldC family transcriptional regulator [Williamsia sp. DF01-3]MDV7132578.1 BldC family transcriptional regulator [Williamsia muralis]PHV65335.1 helix-turn-helix domain-containing protein [Williamsia marianensis]PZT90079.1 MAG: helix-turn-helix domain-containing protein [Gordonia sp. (in: high G+C Gram-positive bacteria)]
MPNSGINGSAAGIAPPTLSPQAASQHTLTPGQVAAMFNVNPKTVARWASSGLLGAIRTPGGHRRFRESDVVALLNRRTPATGS